MIVSSTEPFAGRTATLPVGHLPNEDWSLADWQAHLGGVPAERIRMVPPPGSATEEDLLDLLDHAGVPCELVDGVLVEKGMGWYESIVTLVINRELSQYTRERRLGKVFGQDGPVKTLPGMIRFPDGAFFSWKRWPKTKLARRPVPSLVPDLALEVLSDTNTEAEIERKIHEFFRAGVMLVWIVDPATKSAKSFRSPTDFTEIPPDGFLDGGGVLPGFRLSLKAVFDEADEGEPEVLTT